MQANEASKDRISRTFEQMRRKQLEIYARELREHLEEARRLRQELQEHSRQLAQRVTELTALNRLVQEHLLERAPSGQDYFQLIEGVHRLALNTSALAEDAQSHALRAIQATLDLERKDSGSPTAE